MTPMQLGIQSLSAAISWFLLVFLWQEANGIFQLLPLLVIAVGAILFQRQFEVFKLEILSITSGVRKRVSPNTLGLLLLGFMIQCLGVGLLIYLFRDLFEFVEMALYSLAISLGLSATSRLAINALKKSKRDVNLSGKFLSRSK